MSENFDNFDELIVHTGAECPMRFYIHRGHGDKIINALRSGDRVWSIHDKDQDIETILNLPSIQVIQLRRAEDTKK